jgi:hypothetical protein
MAPQRPSRDAPLVAGDGTQSAALRLRPSRHACVEQNSDFPWDNFDSRWYYDHNYKILRDDDRQIVEKVRDFFVSLDLSGHGHGVDVGSGTNLYPALTMLPFCDKITLFEYSASNISWLKREIQSYSSSWEAFWALLAEKPLYNLIDSPRRLLAAKVHVEKGNIFDLPESTWDIGTMFFAAESISAERSEFQAALDNFVRSLRPGAPFAAAFMENSVGYSVGVRHFPAVAITEDDVACRLAGDTKDLEVYRIGLTNKPLRVGYGGMILATGKIV